MRSWPDVDLHRGLGRDPRHGVGTRRPGPGALVALTVVGDDAERLHREVVGHPAGGPPQQQLQRAVGHLEVVALVLQALELVEHPADDLAVELEPELVRLHGQRRPAGHFRDDDPGPVADQVGLDVLVEVGAARHRTGVQAALVREDRVADVGLLRVRRDVDQLGDVVRHRRQPLQAVGRDGADVELERQVGDGRRQVRVARPARRSR